MKCTIKSIRNIELGDNRFGSRIEGFIPLDSEVIPFSIHKWMADYEGIKKVPYDNGIYVAAWAETTCSDRDTYDSIRGAHIAESKAKAKIYRFIRNFSERMANHYANISDYFQDAYAKYDHCVEHEEDHFDILRNDLKRS